jgi:hypothetical protein
MVRDVNSLLVTGHGISSASIIKEAFELSHTKKAGEKQTRVLPQLKLVGA